MSQILQILKHERLENHVDLVQGGRTILLFTPEERETMQQDYHAAKAAGIDLDAVEWLTRDEVKEASMSRLLLITV